MVVTSTPWVLPSLLLSFPLPKAHGEAGHRMEGWNRLAFLPARTCSRCPFLRSSVGAKNSHILAARQGDCTGSPAWSSPDGPIYRDVVWDEAELIPFLFSGSSWRALGAQERSCEGRSDVPGWGDSGARPRAHLVRLHVSFGPRICRAPCPCWLLSHTTSHLLSPALTPAGGHQSLPGGRDGVLFPSSLLGS